MSTTFVVTLCLTICLSISVVLAQQNNTCPPLPYISLKHGTINRIGYQKYAFECDDGYTLFEHTVRCKLGKWVPATEPYCHKIPGRCNDPPHVEHGRALGDERHVGSLVIYVCDYGYVLLGHSYLSCLSNGYWDKIPPTCMDENEPLETVAERLGNTFVTELESHSADTELGRSLGKDSIALGLELFLLIDRSSSVDPVHLEKAKNFVKFLLEKFVVRNQKDNTNGTRAAVIAFGTEVQIVFNIEDKNITNFRTAALSVDKIQPNGGGTNMVDALTAVMAEIPKLRQEAKRALFLMTDGEPNISSSPEITPQDITSRLKSRHNFEIFTVGIGVGINTFLLTEMASRPTLSHVFFLKDYPDLDVVMKILEDRKPPPPPVSKDQCGYNATGEDRPWLATLYVGGGPMKLCGGVLICSQWVITSATCLQEKGEAVDMKDVFVVLGERDLLKTEKQQTNFYVTEMRIHPRYDPNSIQNDLALLKLNNASEYRPACLPPTDRVIPLHLDRQANASVAGWGRTSEEVTYAEARDVTFLMNSTSVRLSGESECPIQLPGMTMLCAGQGSRSCYSLLGSPLMATDPRKGYQHVLGLQIVRNQCFLGQNQYLELTEYIGWINQETGNCQLKHWGLAE